MLLNELVLLSSRGAIVITYTLQPDRLREGLRAQIQTALVARYGPPRQKMALMAREVGCTPAAIRWLFLDGDSLPIRSTSRFADALSTPEPVRSRWGVAAQLIDWARAYQTRKAAATNRMVRLSQQTDLPSWSRWIAGRLADLGWSLTDLSRALGHKPASWGKRGGVPAGNIARMVRGRVVPHDLRKIERVLGEAPADVKRAVHTATRRIYRAKGRASDRSIKRTRSRWTKYRLTNEVHRKLSGNIPIELRNRLARLDPNKPVGVEGYRIYVSAIGFALNLALDKATARMGVEKMRQSRHKSQTITPRRRLAAHLLGLERGQSALMQCPGCLELQVRNTSDKDSE